MWNARLDEAQAGINIVRRNINNLRYADDTTLMAESKEQLRSFWMKMKEESEKDGLKLSLCSKSKDQGIQSNHFMANRWGNNGNSETLYFLWFQNHCRWWLQSWNWKTLTPWKKSYKNLDNILKSRDIALPAKVHLLKAMVFPVVMYGCESWTIKKADRQRINAFELWC